MAETRKSVMEFVDGKGSLVAQYATYHDAWVTDHAVKLVSAGKDVNSSGFIPRLWYRVE